MHAWKLLLDQLQTLMVTLFTLSIQPVRTWWACLGKSEGAALWKLQGKLSEKLKKILEFLFRSLNEEIIKLTILRTCYQIIWPKFCRSSSGCSLSKIKRAALLLKRWGACFAMALFFHAWRNSFLNTTTWRLILEEKGSRFKLSALAQLPGVFTWDSKTVLINLIKCLSILLIKLRLSSKLDLLSKMLMT